MIQPVLQQIVPVMIFVNYMMIETEFFRSICGILKKQLFDDRKSFLLLVDSMQP
jgi:hypothetical protein